MRPHRRCGAIFAQFQKSSQQEEYVNLRRLSALAAASVALALSTGCALQAPVYQPSIDNVGLLKKAGAAPVAVGAFTVQAGGEGMTDLSLRTSTMTPPAGSNYADYLASALKQELDMARRLDPKVNIEISGVLLKNVVSAGGISRNDGEIEARFVVRRDGQIRFDKIKRGAAEWESSFAGAVAIPKAQQQYPVIVQSLLAALYTDAEFQAATR
jgi:hypothetical protein